MIARMLLTIVSALALLAGLGVGPRVAAAQPSEAVRRADQLFQDGRALLDRGKVAEACPKFEESQRLDPGLGTLLNLADCYERTARLASALTAFRSAEEQARSLGEKKRELAAADRARGLEARVARVTITLAAGDRLAGFVVKRNGAVVSALDFGRPLAVDPGPLTIEASAPGSQPFTRTIEITTAPTKLQVDVPMLAPETVRPIDPVVVVAPVEPGTAPAIRTVDGGRGRRRLGYVVAGIGVAGFGAGVLLGVSAKRAYDRAIAAECRDGDRTQCTMAGVNQVDDARGRGTLGTIVGGVGLAAVAAGAVLWFTAPRAHTVEVAPIASATSVGVTVAGRF